MFKIFGRLVCVSLLSCTKPIMHLACLITFFANIFSHDSDVLIETIDTNRCLNIYVSLCGGIGI